MPNNPSCGSITKRGPVTSESALDPIKKKIQISPNPASKWLTITYIDPNTRYIDMISSDGSTARRRLVAGQTTIQIDVSGIPRGLYIVAIRQENGNSIIEKVMIQ